MEMAGDGPGQPA